MFSHASVARTPTITWNPWAIVAKSMPGETQTVNFSVYVKKLFSKTLCIGSSVRTIAQVSGNLETFVSIFPDTVCDQDTNLDFIISISDDAQPQVVNGSVILSREITLFGKIYTFPIRFGDSLPVTLSIVTEDDSLPPDPGESGKATVEGIDSDSDGVRDDIQRYIALTYPDSEKIRLALTQSAKEVQAQLLSVDDEEESIRLWHAEKAGYCIDYVMGGINEGADMDLALLAEFLNTEERSRAYVRFGQNISGQMSGDVYPWDYKTQCDFNPDEVEN